MQNRRRTKREKGLHRACPTGKVRYADHISAVAGMRETKARRGVDGAQRSYLCKLCKGWHLTHLTSWKERPSG